MRSRMGMTSQSFRIVAAIAAKDIGESLKNKSVVTMIVGLVFLVLSTQALPLLLKLRSRPQMVLVDPGGSSLAEMLSQSDEFSLRVLSTQQEMERWIAESSELSLGFSLPTELDQILLQSDLIELDGYWVYWADPADLEQTVTFFGSQISQRIGKPVIIQTEGNILYPSPNSGGRPFMFSIGFVTALIMVGAMLVPYLMIDEKENRTLDTLLVSPASYRQVVLGKALAGTFYCLTAAAVLLAFNHEMVNQWWLAAFALVLGSLFAVAIGLLMGILFDNVASMNLWLGLVMIILLLPMMLAQTMGAGIPAIIRGVIPWIPSAALAELFRITFSNQVPLQVVLSNLSITLAAALLLLAMVVWRLRLLTR